MLAIDPRTCTRWVEDGQLNARRHDGLSWHIDQGDLTSFTVEHAGVTVQSERGFGATGGRPDGFLVGVVAARNGELLQDYHDTSSSGSSRVGWA